MIQAICPFCSKEYRLPPDVAGRKLKCSACSEKFRIPGESATGSVASTDTKDRSIEACCPRCLAEYKLKPKYAGESVRCKTCRSTFVVLDPNAPEPEPELDDLVDVTPVLSAAKIAPTKSTPRPATPRRPTPEVVELTDDDMVDDSSNGYDLFGDADDMRAAARKGANRSAPAPLPRTTFEPEEPTFTPPKIRKASRKSQSGFGDHLKAIGSGFLSIVVFCSLAYLKYERRKMRNERIRNAIEGPAEPESKFITNMRKAENAGIPPFPDEPVAQDKGTDLMRRHQEQIRKDQQSRPAFPPRNSGFGPGGPPGFGRPPGFPN